MAFTLITITGQFEQADGTPAQGSVTATCSRALTNGALQVADSPEVGHLNSEGKLVNAADEAFKLAANDDAATEPTGTFYEFVVAVGNAPTRTFTAVVPHAAVEGKIDLTELEGV